MPDLKFGEIKFTRMLGADGCLLEPLPSFAQDQEALKSAYRAMVLTRTFDAKAVALQRTGRLGTYASSLGQEAVGVGVARAMIDQDVLLPSFREHGAQLVRGVTPVELLLYWGGDERGSNHAGPVKDFPVSIPVGSHAPHAAGVALALKLRGEEAAAVAIFGDGATSKGDVYEAMNFAGVWHLPVLFVVCNNEWAISVPRRAQTASQTLAQKAIAVGFEGEQVDGNDVLAVEFTVRRALERMRPGGGPHLIEALTYRLGDHTTSDDASRYRSDEIVSGHWKEDPIARLKTYLTEEGGWSVEDEEALLVACRQEIDLAVEKYLATESQAVESIFDYLYAELPLDLIRQRSELIQGGGDDG